MPESKSSSVHPCLPEALLQSFKADPMISEHPSKIYCDEFNSKFRLRALSGRGSFEAGIVFPDNHLTAPSGPSTGSSDLNQNTLIGFGKVTSGRFFTSLFARVMSLLLTNAFGWEWRLIGRIGLDVLHSF